MTIEQLTTMLVQANTERDMNKYALAKYKNDAYKAVGRFVAQMKDLYPDAETFPSCALDLAEWFGIEVLADPDEYPDGDVYADDVLTTCDDRDCDGECDNNYCEAR